MWSTKAEYNTQTTHNQRIEQKVQVQLVDEEPAAVFQPLKVTAKVGHARARPLTHVHQHADTHAWRMNLRQMVFGARREEAGRCKVCSGEARGQIPAGGAPGAAAQVEWGASCSASVESRRRRAPADDRSRVRWGAMGRPFDHGGVPPFDHHWTRRAGGA